MRQVALAAPLHFAHSQLGRRRWLEAIRRPGAISSTKRMAATTYDRNGWKADIDAGRPSSAVVAALHPNLSLCQCPMPLPARSCRPSFSGWPIRQPSVTEYRALDRARHPTGKRLSVQLTANCIVEESRLLPASLPQAPCQSRQFDWRLTRKRMPHRNTPRRQVGRKGALSCRATSDECAAHR